MSGNLKKRGRDTAASAVSVVRGESPSADLESDPFAVEPVARKKHSGAGVPLSRPPVEPLVPQAASADVPAAVVAPEPSVVAPAEVASKVVKEVVEQVVPEAVAVAVAVQAEPGVPPEDASKPAQAVSAPPPLGPHRNTVPGLRDRARNVGKVSNGFVPELSTELLSGLIVDSATRAKLCAGSRRSGDTEIISTQLRNIFRWALNNPSLTSAQNHDAIFSIPNVQLALKDVNSYPALAAMRWVGRLFLTVANVDPKNVNKNYAALTPYYAIFQEGTTHADYFRGIPRKQSLLYTVQPDPKGYFPETKIRVVLFNDIDMLQTITPADVLARMKTENEDQYNAQPKKLADLGTCIKAGAFQFDKKQMPKTICPVTMAALRVAQDMGQAFWSAPDMKCESIYSIAIAATPEAFHESLIKTIEEMVKVPFVGEEHPTAFAKKTLLDFLPERLEEDTLELYNKRMEFIVGLQNVFQETEQSMNATRLRDKSGIESCLRFCNITPLSPRGEDVVELARRLPEKYTAQDVLNLALALRYVAVAVVMKKNTNSVTEFVKEANSDSMKAMACRVRDTVDDYVAACEEAEVPVCKALLVSPSLTCVNMSRKHTSKVANDDVLPYVENFVAANWDAILRRDPKIKIKPETLKPIQKVNDYYEHYFLPEVANNNIAAMKYAKGEITSETFFLKYMGTSIYSIRKPNPNAASFAVDITMQKPFVPAGSLIEVGISMHAYASGKGEQAKQGTKWSYFGFTLLKEPDAGFKLLTAAQGTVNTAAMMEDGEYEVIGLPSEPYLQIEDAKHPAIMDESDVSALAALVAHEKACAEVE